MLEHMEETTPLSTARTYDLGQHLLEVLEDQSVLMVDQQADKEVVQLDAQESYRLLAVLRSVFTSE